MYIILQTQVYGKTYLSSENDRILYSTPVSYTHLDVYKRQNQHRCCYHMNEEPRKWHGDL